MRNAWALVLLLFPVSAFGQSVFEATGSRALGMAGAFVAVADDATAVWWNPAGLATGNPAGMTIGWVDFRVGDPEAPPVPGADHRTSRFVSLGTMPVGVSYGHFETLSLVRRPDGSTAAESFKTSQFGLTVLQSLTPGFVVGTTLKYVHGAASSMPAEGLTIDGALDRVEALEGPSHGEFNMDIGMMADMGKLRVGLTVRNLQQPTFVDNAGFATVLPRQTRLGFAVLPTRGLTFAMDMDLDTANLLDGPRRILAFGGEDRIGRFALRGGMRWSLEGLKHRVYAVGMSLSIRPKFWLDGHYTQGDVDADHGFGFAMRAGF